MAKRIQLLFNEVSDALQQLAEGKPSSAPTNSNMKMPEVRNHILELEVMLQKEKAEFEVRCHSFFFCLSLF